MSSLVCNSNGCKTALMDKCYASTECLHCFCKLHAQEYINKCNTCPVCDIPSKLFTVVLTEPFDERCLAGLPPDKILEAIDLATRFQLTQSENSTFKARSQLKLFSTQAQQMQAGFKQKLAQATTQNQQLKSDLARKHAEVASLRKELGDVKEQYLRMRDQLKHATYSSAFKRN